MHLKLDTFAATTASAVNDTLRAEAIGFDGIWFGEYGNDAISGLTVAAARRPRLQLGTAVAGALTRNPMECAYRLADAQRLAGCRLAFGVGLQARPVVLHQYGATWTHPLARLREFRAALVEIWDAWSGGRAPRFRGEFTHHTYCPAPLIPTGIGERPRVLLGAVGPKARHLAATEFDGLITHPCSPPSYLREVITPAFRLAAADAPDGDHELVALSMLFLAGSEDAAAAIRDEMRLRIAFWAAAGVHQRTLAYIGCADLTTAVKRLLRRGEIHEIASVVDDEVVNAICTIGDEETVVSAINDYYRGVVDRACVIIDGSVPVEAAARVVERTHAL